MDENKPTDSEPEGPNAALEAEAQRLRDKRVPVPETASRGRFVGVGLLVAGLIYALAVIFAPPKEAPMPAPVQVALPEAPQIPLPPPPAPVEHIRQYEEAIGPPLYVPPVPKPVIRHTTNGKVQIALVLDDCGISNTQTGPTIDLPKEITLSFLPYGRATPGMSKRAIEAGHDVMLHMPMQPVGHDDPGPNPITPRLAPEIIKERIDSALADVPGAVGMNNHMGSAATADGATMAAVMQDLKDKDIFFLDSYTSAKSQAYAAAVEAGIRTTRRDVFLDDTISAEAITAQLDRLEKVAAKQGAAIAIGHPHPLTMELLKNWLATLPEKGIELIRVKDLARKQE